MVPDQVSKIDVDKEDSFPFSIDTRCAGLKRIPHENGSVGRKALSGSSRAVSQWDDVNVLGRNMLDYVGS